MKREVWVVVWKDDRGTVHEMLARRDMVTEQTARGLARNRFPRLTEITEVRAESVHV